MSPTFMHPSTRFVRHLLAPLCVLLLLVSGAQAYGQTTEPGPIIDTVFRDLSARLGTSVTRANSQSYTWEQKIFPDGSLGCPEPGKSYTAAQTLGYTVIVRYQDQQYDYRLSNDGTTYFICADGKPLPPAVIGQGTPAPTAIPAVNVPSSQTGLLNTSAATSYNNPIAFVAGDGNVYIADLTARTLSSATALTGDAAGSAVNYYPYYDIRHNYFNLSWSPDGTRLAFMDNISNALFIARSGQKAIPVATGIATEFSPAWSADGGELFYAVGTGQPAKSGSTSGTETLYQVQAIPANGGAPRAVGQFPHGTGCGGGGIDGSYAAYQSEAGYNLIPKILAQVPDGFLYTSSCFGVGVGLANLTNQGTWQRADLSAPEISPNRTKLVAIGRTAQGNPTGTEPREGSGIVEIVDIKTGAGTRLNVPQNVTQVAWSSDGLSIFYSTLTPAGSLIVGEQNKAVAQTLFPEVPFTVPLFTAELWRLPVSGGQAVRLYSREGRGIANIAATPDGANVTFSFITSYSALADTLAKGGTAAQAVAVGPRAEIIVVPLSGGAAYKLVTGGRAVLAQGLFTASPVTVIAPTAPNTNAATPTLVIGGQAVVTVKEGSLNIRAQPSVNATVRGYLPKGTVVTIIAGPQAADGFRWWQVQAPSGNNGWVVDQVVENGETITALTPQP